MPYTPRSPARYIHTHLLPNQPLTSHLGISQESQVSCATYTLSDMSYDPIVASFPPFLAFTPPLHPLALLSAPPASQPPYRHRQKHNRGSRESSAARMMASYDLTPAPCPEAAADLNANAAQCLDGDRRVAMLVVGGLGSSAGAGAGGWRARRGSG